MQFLVQIRASIPDVVDDAERLRVAAAERARGAELVEAGIIKEIWRVPGTGDNVGVWECTDADELHQALTSLPAHRWMTVAVTPLATHPLMTDVASAEG